jgi:hypothetical protein
MQQIGYQGYRFHPLLSCRHSHYTLAIYLDPILVVPVWLIHHQDRVLGGGD